MNSVLVNLTAYKFVTIEPAMLPILREQFRTECHRLALKGTVMLSPEGINFYVSGTEAQALAFIQFLETFPFGKDLEYKRMPLHSHPYTRMLVKIKKEIIALHYDAVQPEQHTVATITPQELKAYYDEGEDFIMLDARNDYEIKLGAFKQAQHLNIESFSDFPEALAALGDDWKDKKIVTYCTGGIRCEKSGELMHQMGYHNVRQLEGGIINYFVECGGEHYEGECFVFDKRVGIDATLEETDTEQCYACRSPLLGVEKSLAQCPYCESA